MRKNLLFWLRVSLLLLEDIFLGNSQHSSGRKSWIISISQKGTSLNVILIGPVCHQQQHSLPRNHRKEEKMNHRWRSVFRLSRFKKTSECWVDLKNQWVTYLYEEGKEENRRKLCSYSSTSNDFSSCCFQKQQKKSISGKQKGTNKTITNNHEAKGSGCLNQEDGSKHLWMATKNEARRLSLQPMWSIQTNPNPKRNEKVKTWTFSFITSQNKIRHRPVPVPSTSVTFITRGKGFHFVNYFINLQTALDFVFSRGKVQGPVYRMTNIRDTSKILSRIFHGGPEAKTPCSQCRAPWFNPWWGGLDPICCN